MNQYSTSAAGLDLIETFEGDALVAYPDPGTGGAPWSIGRGHTGSDVYPGLTITAAQRDALFAQDVVSRGEVIIKRLNLRLTQCQFDALVSFVFNVGPGQAGVKDGLVVLRSGAPSTLLKLLRARDYLAAADQFLLWNHANGRVMPGLTKRRQAERALFLRGT
jgi:lysozyme